MIVGIEEIAAILGHGRTLGAASPREVALAAVVVFGIADLYVVLIQRIASQFFNRQLRRKQT